MKTKNKIAVIAMIGMSLGVKSQEWNSDGSNFSTENLTLDGSYINLNTPITSGRWALGFFNIDADKKSRIGGVGLLGSKDKPTHYYMAHGKRPWTSGLGIYVKTNGNVGIGTTNPDSWELAVNGKIRAKEIKVETGWSDFIFEDEYKLPTLQEVENHIKEKGHLKDIPSAKEVEKNGIFLGAMDAKLLQKIEELTLYTIAQQKEIERLKLIEKRLSKIEKLLESKK